MAGWCRGRDLNPHELTPTAPSRPRVYLFHHLGLLTCGKYTTTSRDTTDRVRFSLGLSDTRCTHLSCANAGSRPLLTVEMVGLNRTQSRAVTPGWLALIIDLTRRSLGHWGAGQSHTNTELTVAPPKSLSRCRAGANPIPGERSQQSPVLLNRGAGFPPSRE